VTGTRRPTVLWVAKGLGRGGLERLLVLLAEHAHDDVEIHVCYLRPDKTAFIPQLERAGVTVHRLGEVRDRGPWWVWRLARLVRRSTFDVVHTHSPVPGVVARLVPVRGVRYLHTEHSEWSRYHVLTRLLNAVTLCRNERVLAVSDAVAHSVRRPRLLPRSWWPPVERLYHGIDLAAVRRGRPARDQARATMGLTADQPVVGSVASLTWKKNADALIEAVVILRGTFPALRLVLVGDGPERERLERFVDDLGVREHVLFLGVRSDVQELLPGFDVFALASLAEGLGLAAVEALAAGVPCVVTPVGGLLEVLPPDESAGLFAAAGSGAAMATALGELLGSPERRAELALNGEAVARRFDIRRAAGRMSALYGENREVRAPT
jgi:glycosyltransferase involved in cell wall biosynthesis